MVLERVISYSAGSGTRKLPQNIVQNLIDAKNSGVAYNFVSIEKANIAGLRAGTVTDYYDQAFRYAQANGLRIYISMILQYWDSSTTIPNNKTFDNAFNNPADTGQFITDLAFVLARYKKYGQTFAGMFFEEPYYHETAIKTEAVYQARRNTVNAFFVNVRRTIDSAAMSPGFDILTTCGTGKRCPQTVNGVFSMGYEGMGFDSNYIANKFNTTGQCRTETRTVNALNKPLITVFICRQDAVAQWTGRFKNVNESVASVAFMEVLNITLSSILQSPGCLAGVKTACANQNFFAEMDNAVTRHANVIIFNLNYVGWDSSYYTSAVNAAFPGATVGEKIRAITARSCVPVWRCENPPTGYETDGCGNRRANPACNTTCTPNWQCESPLNGYESDGCGHRRQAAACNAPTTGTLEVTSVPSGAQVIKSSTLQGVTPMTKNYFPGSFDIVVRLAGYEDATDTVNITLGNITHKNYNLVALPTTGSLNVSTIPPGARIIIDNSDTGRNTPNRVDNLSAGSHTVKLTLNAYKDFTDTVSITAGQTLNKMYPLDPIPTTGSITLKSSPSGAAIKLDGVDTGEVTPHTFTNKDPGTHAFELTLAGFQPYANAVEVVAGMDISRDILLIAGEGALSVSTTPTGADVWLNGKLTTMQTNFTTNLPAGTYSMTLVMKGFQDITDSVTVAPDRMTSKVYTFAEGAGAQDNTLLYGTLLLVLSKVI